VFGYLYIEEKKTKKELKSLISKLQRNSGWASTVARSVDHAAAPTQLAQMAKEYRTVIADISRKIPGASIINLRYWRDALRGLVKLAASPVISAPSPAAPAALPSVPPGLKCPHYTKASAFPKNWADAAAEQRYLKKYADVSGWTDVMKKRFKGKGLNALWHYRCYGRKEGRTWAGLGGIPGYLR
jgi:hypothetical protein